MDFTRYREWFPITENYTYLLSGGVTAMSTPVMNACDQYLNEYAQKGNAGARPYLAEARSQFARLVHCDAKEVACVPSVSYGIGMVALMLNPKKGENIVINDLDFTSNVYPWLRYGKMGVEVRVARSKDGVLPVDEIAKHVDDNTRVVTATHVNAYSGYRHDLKALGKVAHAHGARVVVDGASSTGVTPIDVKDFDVDFFSVSSQKWLMGPGGAGFLYVKRELIDQLEPPMPGWYGTISLGDLDAQKYEQIEFSRGEASMLAEVGTPSVLSYVGVTAGMKMIQEVGPENIFKRISDLTQYGIEKVKAIGRRVFTPLDRERRAGEIVVQLKPGEDAPTIAGELDSKKKIKVEALTHTDAGLRLGPQWKGGAINFQPTFYNTEDEIDYLVKSLGAY